MKVLIGSINAWHDSNAIGNTLSNWFSEQSDMEFSNIYSRSEMPSNKVCKSYFRITEIQMLKHIFSPEKIGGSFTLDLSQAKEAAPKSSGSKERGLINFIKKWNLKPAYMLSQSLWNSNLWLNGKFQSYIKDFSPDIFFSFATEPIILRKRMEAVKRIAGAKTVLFVADDVYSVYLESKLPKAKQVISDFEWCIQNCDLVYGASEELCKEYKEKFKREFCLLYKGCTVAPVKEKNHETIKLVYAGNLFYGRDKTLCELVKAMKTVNESGKKKMQLDIYTASPTSEENAAVLNTDGVSKIVGSRPYSEVVSAMQDADIVLHVESFDPQEIKKVRLSYSTKIIDCLQSGSCTLAIGPDGIASIHYLKKTDGAITVTDTEDLTAVLRELSDNYEKISAHSVLTNKYAKEYHDIRVVRNNIKNDFINLLKG